MNIDKSYLSRIIRNHEKKGYVIRKVSETDSRAYHLHLTEAGLRLTKDFIQKSDQQVETVIHPLAENDCTELMKALDTVTSILQTCNRAE